MKALLNLIFFRKRSYCFYLPSNWTERIFQTTRVMTEKEAYIFSTAHGYLFGVCNHKEHEN